MSSATRKAIAEETVAIIEAGEYVNPMGERVSLAAGLAAMAVGTLLIRPADFEALAARIAPLLGQHAAPATLRLLPETTFATCRHWVQDLGLPHVACLNFASGKNPGGGFLWGTQAQEEVLARSSTLYHSLLQAPDYYAIHRAQGTALYSDHMIWSPGVAILRDDAEAFLAAPVYVDVLTSPAVKLVDVLENEPEALPQAEAVMRQRAERILQLAVAQGVQHLVLGAWGCGVFRNDPTMVASAFLRHLVPGGKYARAFAQVAFSIPSGGASALNYQAFERALSAIGS